MNVCGRSIISAGFVCCPSTWYKFWHTICFLWLFMLHHKILKWEDLLCITGASVNQGCDSEASPAYLRVLHCVLCVGYLFHVSASDSFHVNSFQVDLVIEGVIKGLFPGCFAPPYVFSHPWEVGRWVVVGGFNQTGSKNLCPVLLSRGKAQLSETHCCQSGEQISGLGWARTPFEEIWSISTLLSAGS